MNRIIVSLLALIILSSCATLGVYKPDFDPNNSCTEETLKAYRLLTSKGYQYQMVIGFRYDVIGELISTGAHAWIEYRKPGEDWQIYDPYIVHYKDMHSIYHPVIRGKEAEKYFLAEEFYHNLNYDSKIEIIKDVDRFDFTVFYTFIVSYKPKGDKDWKIHTF